MIKIPADLKQEITRIIAGHLDLYELVAESVTDEIVSLLEQRICCSTTESSPSPHLAGK
jgi:hypothetical protein